MPSLLIEGGHHLIDLHLVDLPDVGQPGDIAYQIDINPEGLREAAEVTKAAAKFVLYIRVLLPERTVPGSIFAVLSLDQLVHSEDRERLVFEPAIVQFYPENESYRHFYLQVFIDKHHLLAKDIRDHTWNGIRPGDRLTLAVREPIREYREILACPEEPIEFKVLDEPIPEYITKRVKFFRKVKQICKQIIGY